MPDTQIKYVEEQAPLLGSEARPTTVQRTESKPEQITTKTQWSRTAPGLIITVLAFLIIWTAEDHNRRNSGSSVGALTDNEISKISLVSSNEYTALHGHPAKDYSWIEAGTLVEPYRTTTLMLRDLPDRLQKVKLTLANCQGVHTGTGHVVGSSGDDDSSSSTTARGSAASCSLVFTEVGDYKVSLSLQTSDGSSLGDLSEQLLVCRYVRRDLRKITDSDRSLFMDAIRTLFDVSLEEGVTTYGTSFKPMSHFVASHLESSVPDSSHDRMHDGMGFYSQHVSITNEFEAALQVVDPVVSIPFWDFTQDFATLNATARAEKRSITYGDLWSMDVWSEDWFGDASGSKLHTVTQGRWAYLEVPKASSVSSKTRDLVSERSNPTPSSSSSASSSESSSSTFNPLAGNALGFLRAPWNLNGSPYVTRVHKQCGGSIGGSASYVGNQWPTCRSHYEAVFTLDSNSIGQLVPYLAYQAHGGVHLMIGGAAGSCEHWAAKLADKVGSELVMDMQFQSSFLLRNVWRFGLCSVPSDAQCKGTMRSDGEECKMQCQGCTDDVFDDDLVTEYDQWWDPSLAGALNVSQKKVLIKEVFCDSKIFVGEHVEASSPVDPSFWPLHPTLERLIHYKQLINPIEDMTWDASDYESDWTSLCKWARYFDTDCGGHGESDLTTGTMTVLPESSGDDDDNDDGGSSAVFLTDQRLTNREVVQLATDTRRLPYVYADFDYSHCRTDGVNFPPINVNSS